MTDPATHPVSGRRIARWCVTALIIAIVGWFAGKTLIDGWRELADAPIDIAGGWLVLAGILYLAGMLPMALFWRLVLHRFEQPTAWQRVIRAYYLGHLGKYVPGKAMVIAIRTAAVTSERASPRAIIVSVFLETLTFMASGAVLAALVAPLLRDVSSSMIAMALGLAVVAGTPCLPPIARWLATRVAGGANNSDVPHNDWPRAITWSLVTCGLVLALVSWLVLAIGLWATARAVGGVDATPFANWPVWIECAALPMVAGFLSLLPGGVGVRDVLVAGLLAPHTSPAAALVIATLWRLVSLLSELAICGILTVPRLSPPRSPIGRSKS